MRDRSKVTVVLSEKDAREMLQCLKAGAWPPVDLEARLIDELKHALAECDCAGEVGR